MRSRASTLPKVAGEVSRVLSRLGHEHMVIGGVAVIARGVPRLTRDVDVTLWGAGVDVKMLLAAFAKAKITPRIDDAEAFARQNQILLLQHRPTKIEIDASLAWLGFEREALDHAEPIAFGRVRVPVATAEDLVVYKTVAWRDRDRDDIARLLEVHGRKIDLNRVRRHVRELSEAMENPDRLTEFDRFISELG